MALEKTYDEVVSYVKAQGLIAFKGIPLLGEQPNNVMLWDEGDKNWKEFVDAAKAEGAKTLVISKEYGQGKHANDVGSITLAWAKDGIVYLYEQSEDWFEEQRSGKLPNAFLNPPTAFFVLVQNLVIDGNGAGRYGIP
ncbi:MAG: hypothetical protein ACP5SK_00635 [Thermoprotei archaeon]|nr:hypothetical protein [TACK group archaeon]